MKNESFGSDFDSFKFEFEFVMCAVVPLSPIKSGRLSRLQKSDAFSL